MQMRGGLALLLVPAHISGGFCALLAACVGQLQTQRPLLHMRSPQSDGPGSFASLSFCCTGMGPSMGLSGRIALLGPGCLQRFVFAAPFVVITLITLVTFPKEAGVSFVRGTAVVTCCLCPNPLAPPPPPI